MTRKRPTRSCQHCGDEIISHAHAGHERACVKHPGDAVLLRMFDDDEWDIRPLATHFEVSHGIIERWLRRAGAKRRVPALRKRKQTEAYWELSILEPCHGGCKKCDWLRVCRARVDSGMPILSEAPLKKEIPVWIRRGWIPADWERNESKMA